MTPHFTSLVVGACSALIVSPISNLLGGPVMPFLHLVQSPFRVFTLGECLPENDPFLCKEAQDCYTLLEPMGEGVDNTKFC